MTELDAGTAKVYIIEDQEIYREIYRYVLPAPGSISLLDVTDVSSLGTLQQATASLRPDVLLLSTRKLEPAAIAELEVVRADNPGMGMIMLLMHYSSQDVELLRRLALNGDGGMALFLKQSLDQIDQLRRTILAVHQGQVILDPQLASFMFAGKPESPFLKQLTARELEILSLLSRGLTNSAIADALFIDIKTVEHHLNSMYSKLKADVEFTDKHLRVSAARLYLEIMSEPYSKGPSPNLTASRR